MFGTQDEQGELCSIWERLKAGTERDKYFQLDLANSVSASIRLDNGLEQVLSFHGVARYSDSSEDSADSHKHRTRPVETTSWGMWEDYRIT
jgi:hypothetical protein